MSEVKTINGIEVFNNEILTLSVNGKVALYADAQHFEKLVKKYMKDHQYSFVSKAYKLLISEGEYDSLKFDSIFLNKLDY